MRASSRMHAEWQRLYAAEPAAEPTAAAGASPALIDAQGRTRTLVLGLHQPATWEALSSVWQAVQAEGGLPAPGIAVSGTDSFQLWFSLAEAVPAAEGHAFLVALQRRCLAQVPTARLSLWPTPDASTGPDAIPARQGDAEQWSAFVAPDLAPMFDDTPWLDLPPSPEGQADLLARLRSIPRQAWLEAQTWVQAQGASDAAQPRPERTTPAATLLAPSEANHHAAHATQATRPALDPHTFLHQVMNDTSVPLALRIEAAKALLPHHVPPRA